jgi:lipopolysaccharide/colanic/teichoic acid biosynthesis glycosyltransferase
MRSVQLRIKRFVDFVVASVGVVLLCPAMLCIALLIKLTSKGPVFFSQERLGKDAKVFRLYKFRTMVPGAINMGAGLSITERDPRVTHFGSFLRKCSLDEFPQLFNVIRGDISLVGPRPTVPEHLEYYGEFERRRLEMRPGITGLAMVRGRASIPWSQRIKYDGEYINDFSLWLDLRILMETVWVVLRRKNVYYDYEKHGPPFDLVKPADRVNSDGEKLL